MASDFTQDIRDLRATMASVREVVDLDRLATTISDLETKAGAPDLWDDPDSAQKVTSALSRAIAERDRILELDQRIDDLEVLVELGQEEGDEATMNEAERELTSIRRSARARAEWTPPTSRRCSCACICAGPSATASRPR